MVRQHWKILILCISSICSGCSQDSRDSPTPHSPENNQQDAADQTGVWIQALHDGDYDALTRLLRRGVDVDLRFGATIEGTMLTIDVADATGLMYAASTGNIELQDFLIRANANPSARTRYGLSVLDVAALCNESTSIEFLGAHGVELSEDGLRAMSVAAQSANLQSIEALLELGISPSCNGLKNGCPLVRAAGATDKHGDRLATIRLLASNLYGEERAIQLDEALLAAARAGDPDVVKILLQLGSNINAEDSIGMNVAHHAAANGNAKVIQVLADEGLDLNAVSASGRTPLHYAAAGLHIDAVELLIRRGAQPRRADNQGLIPAQLVPSNSDQLHERKAILDHLSP